MAKKKAKFDTLKVTNVGVYPTKVRGTKTIAIARVTLNEQLQLTGLRVVNGVNGYFVTYPLDPSYKGEEYMSIYYPITKGLREEIELSILKRYQEVATEGDYEKA